MQDLAHERPRQDWAAVGCLLYDSALPYIWLSQGCLFLLIFAMSVASYHVIWRSTCIEGCSGNSSNRPTIILLPRLCYVAPGSARGICTCSSRLLDTSMCCGAVRAWRGAKAPPALIWLCPTAVSLASCCSSLSAISGTGIKGHHGPYRTHLRSTPGRSTSTGLGC